MEKTGSAENKRNLNMITLKQYTNEENQILPLIQGFWKAHSHYDQSGEEAQEDLTNWTKDGHIIYFIQHDETVVGFAHLGSRGGKTDWLEELFILPEYQGNGFGSEAIHQLEEIVKQYSASLYIEAAARNEAAIRLYRKLGYDCLNTITIRKDFPGYEYDVVRKEKIHELEFEIRKDKAL